MAAVRLAFLWHMHQPLYRQPETGAYVLPWVRLHATRAYLDMAAALERHERIRCTVNITPVLLEQLDDYVRKDVRDAYLDLSVRPAGDLRPEERQTVLRSFFMNDWDTSIRPVPRYWELLEKRGRDLRRIDLPRTAQQFTEAEITDLQLLFNLGWMGFAALDEDGGLREIRKKGRDYTREEVAYVISAQRRIIGEIVPRWRRLADRGQIELSTTPYYHPILPLICDSDSAARALPGIPLPPRFAHPDDARWHVREAIESHARRFGRRPAGIWPAEGSVSPEALEILASEGVSWICSDEEVLLRSLPAGSSRLRSIYRPWIAPTGEGRNVALLFRDRGLSDLIGFTYAKLSAEAAASDLLSHVESIGRAWSADGAEGPATVGIFLDGENPWEHFADSGQPFLDALYRRIEASPAIQTMTVSEAVANAGGASIERIHSGSWIEASFRIWIGHQEDRLAWTALGKARDAVESTARTGNAPPAVLEQARRHLFAAEGSDWYWWYGEDFSTELAAEFDSLFRGHLIRACCLLGVAPPPEAIRPIKRLVTAGLEVKLLREPTTLITPVLDGKETTFFEWQGSGLHHPVHDQGSMFGGAQAFQALYYAFDLENLYLRLDPVESPRRTLEIASELRIALLGPDQENQVDFPITGDGAVHEGRIGEIAAGRACFARVMEAAIPFASLKLRAGDQAAFHVEIVRTGIAVERLPRHGLITFSVPDKDFEQVHWKV